MYHHIQLFFFFFFLLLGIKPGTNLVTPPALLFLFYLFIKNIFKKFPLLLFAHLFIYLVGLGFELRASRCKAGALPLEAPSLVHSVLVIFEMGGLRNCFPGLASNCDLLDLSG
jgi:hypothetical protein